MEPMAILVGVLAAVGNFLVVVGVRQMNRAPGRTPMALVLGATMETAAILPAVSGTAGPLERAVIPLVVGMGIGASLGFVASRTLSR